MYFVEQSRESASVCVCEESVCVRECDKVFRPSLTSDPLCVHDGEGGNNSAEETCERASIVMMCAGERRGGECKESAGMLLELC